MRYDRKGMERTLREIIAHCANTLPPAEMLEELGRLSLILQRFRPQVTPDLPSLGIKPRALSPEALERAQAEGRYRRIEKGDDRAAFSPEFRDRIAQLDIEL